MAKINSLLSERLKGAREKFSKMTELAEMSGGGNLTSFSGIFKITPLNTQEKLRLEELLESYKNSEQETEGDFLKLAEITSEVRAITNQAAILHGERIKRAQQILKNYRDGAFSAWLMATYGNRQTPYNFLQYYEFYQQLSPHLHNNLEAMPRQAVYTLASRSAPLNQKEEVVQNYKGEPKAALLSLIRKLFPLAEEDKRKEDRMEQVLTLVKKAEQILEGGRYRATPRQKKTLLESLEVMKKKVLADV